MNKMMNKINFVFTIVVISIVLSSCSNKSKFDAAVSTGKRNAEYSKLSKILNKHYERAGKRYTIELDTNQSFLFTNNVKLLIEQSKYEFAVITNSITINKDTVNNLHNRIRTVIPLSSRILYIAYNSQNLTPKSIDDLFNNTNVVILSNETVFIENILKEFGINLTRAHFLKSRFNKEDPEVLELDAKVRDSILKVDYMSLYKQNLPLPYDVEIGIIPMSFSSNSRLNKLFNSHSEFKLFTLDDYKMYNNGSTVEGFCLRNKYFTPYLLPKGTYGEYPENPILTIRQDFVLASREDVDDEFIYELVKTAIEETDMIDLAIYGKNLENINFAFPLHEGTKRYLDKNAPKFYEKYSDMLAKIGTGVGGLYTVIVGFILWRKRRKRRIIMIDFQKVLDIQTKIKTENTLDELNKMYDELQVIEENYQKMTLEHKILVDETLKIFFDTINKNEQYILNEIKKKMEKL